MLALFFKSCFTKLEAQKAKGKIMRCTQATLEALNIFGECPTYGTGVIEALKKHKKEFRVVEDHAKTLRSFVRENEIGSFYLTVAGHAIACVNGILTDTTERGADCRRILVVIQIIEPYVSN